MQIRQEKKQRSFLVRFGQKWGGENRDDPPDEREYSV